MGKKVDECRETFSKELENIKKYQSYLKIKIPEMKNTLEGINSILDGTEE